MKAIDIKLKNKTLIKIQKIKNFKNKCKVTGYLEDINIEIEYIPNNKVVELDSYREYFYSTVFNEYIETLANIIFEKIYNLLSPQYLKIEIFLLDKQLTPWSVIIERGNR